MNNPMSDKQRDELMRETMTAPELDFEVGSEPWVTIKVEDGAELKLRLVVKQVKRISDDPVSGEPRYFVGHDQLLRIAKRPEGPSR